MRKKITMSAVLAAVLIMALVGTAFAVGINLFDYFGKNYERFREIAPQTELARESAAEICTEELGVTRVSFNSAYYDGQSLLIGYTIENGRRTEAFAPTDAQLADMERLEPGKMFWRGSEGRSSGWIPEGFEEAVAEGRPCGTVQYSICAHDTFEANGVQLSSSMGLQTDAVDAEHHLVEFTNPLPETVQNVESVEIRMGIGMSTAYIWFDGEAFYLSSEQRDLGELRTVASRSNAAKEVYAGEGSYNGVPIHLRAEVSAVHATLEISADGEAFPRFADDDTWYDVCLVDEQGELLTPRGLECKPDAFRLQYEGIGRSPAALRAYIVVCAEDSEWTFAELMADAEPILLVAQP